METVPESRSPFDDDDDVEGSYGSVKSRSRFLLWSAGVAAISFLVSLISSVVENNATGNPGLETMAIRFNRGGMLGMLVGCFGIFLFFRMRTLLNKL